MNAFTIKGLKKSYPGFELKLDLELPRGCILGLIGENDGEEEMRELSGWVAGLQGKVPGRQIPLHVTRFFPRFHVTDRGPTPVETVLRLSEVAREKLDYVYTGNL